jgi:hypothetical protein
MCSVGKMLGWTRIYYNPHNLRHRWCKGDPASQHWKKTITRDFSLQIVLILRYVVDVGEEMSQNTALVPIVYDGIRKRSCQRSTQHTYRRLFEKRRAVVKFLSSRLHLKLEYEGSNRVWLQGDIFVGEQAEETKNISTHSLLGLCSVRLNSTCK